MFFLWQAICNKTTLTFRTLPNLQELFLSLQELFVRSLRGLQVMLHNGVSHTYLL